MIEFLEVTKLPERHDQLRELFQEYQEGLGIDLCFQGFEEELRALPGKYAMPLGRLYMLVDGEEAIGCGALKPLNDAGTCEIKRIYIRPSHRRMGLARQLSEKLIEDARAIGYSVVKLDTLGRLEGAVKLYTELGFTRADAYNFNPQHDILYFKKAL